MSKRNFILTSLVVISFTTSSFLFAESQAAKENKALFNGVVSKLYGKQAEQIESSVSKMHEKRDQAIEKATGSEDDLNGTMAETEAMSQKLLQAAEALKGDPKKLELMKSSLPAEMRARLEGSGNADPTAAEMGLMQALDMFREMSQFQVENYLKLSLIPDVSDQENYFVRYPQLITYMATTLRDKEAIPSLLQISKQMTKIMFFFVFLIASFLLSKLLVKFYNRNVSFIVAIGRFFVRVFTFYSLRLIFFCYLFYDQLSPMGKLLRSFIIDFFKATT